MSEQDFEVLTVIAARKSAYYTYVKGAFLKEISKTESMSKEMRQAVEERLLKAISELPNNLFLSETEKTNKKIYSNLSLDQLKLNQDKIKRLVLEKVEEL